ncbi:MAG TPA: AraC family transcriptional regulator [Pyrinomonadaceae bacterium]|jgi:AraC family transcriptional regulator
MSAAAPPADRIFTRPPHFSVHLRAGRRLRWSGAAGSGYAALLLLRGSMRWRASPSEADAAGAGEGVGRLTAAAKLTAGSRREAAGGSRGKAAGGPRGKAAGDSPGKAAGDSGGKAAGDSGDAGAEAESGEVAAAAALLSAPGDSLAAASAGAAEYVLVQLSPVFVADCAARAGLARTDLVVTFRARAVAGDERLARLARDLAEELREEAAGQGLVVGALVEQALVHLLRRYANLRRSAHLELSRAGLVDRRLRLAVELMHARLDRDLSLEEIAAAAHLSPFHFARLFKKLTGATPHAYLASLRAARAQQLLAETDLPVTEVGARVGYMSSSHFARAFRQATGLSPSAYRKALVRG